MQGEKDYGEIPREGRETVRTERERERARRERERKREKERERERAWRALAALNCGSLDT